MSNYLVPGFDEDGGGRINSPLDWPETIAEASALWCETCWTDSHNECNGGKRYTVRVAEEGEGIGFPTSRDAANHGAIYDYEAVAWAYGKCLALGLENGTAESAEMMDRLKAML